jgi:hypothetical protein
MKNFGSGKHEYGSATPRARTAPGGVVRAGKETVQKLQNPFPVQQLEVPKMQKNHTDHNRTWTRTMNQKDLNLRKNLFQIFKKILP